MDSDRIPFDAVVAAAVVAKAIDEIDKSSEVDRDFLLSTLLCAAWPTRPAQNQ
jgi:hypothetical protein